MAIIALLCLSMLESLASLHYSCLYEQAEEPPQVCLKPLRSWASLSLAFCAYVTGAQTVEAQPTLQPGDSGEDVEKLHEQLKSAKCWPARFPSALPNYDDYTGAAVSRLQRRHGEQLALGGVVNEQTAAAIEAGWTCDPSQDEGALKLGSQSEDVRMLQVQLNNWGFPLTGERLEATGIFDPATEAALKEFEAYFGLEADSIFDPLDSQILWTPRVTALVRALQQETNVEQIGTALINLPSAEKSQATERILTLIGSGEKANVNIKGNSEAITPSAAALALLQTDQDVDTTIPRLAALVSDDTQSERTQASAAEALGYSGSEAKAAVPDLIALLSETEFQDVRQSAAEALGAIGTDAQVVVPSLVAVLSDSTEDDSFRRDAAQALGEIGAGDASVSARILPELIAAVNDKVNHPRNVRDQSLSSIDALDLEADQVISDLISIATDDSNEVDVSAEAIRQIGQFGADAEEAVEPLITLLNDSTEKGIGFALQIVAALGEIGPAAQAAIPTLISLFEDQSRFGKPSAEEISLDQMLANRKQTFLLLTPSKTFSLALAKLGNAAVPELISALQSQDEKVRYGAAFALGQMDRLNRNAVRALEDVMNNPNENINIRRMAADSLEKSGRDVQDFWTQNGLESFATRQAQTCPENYIFSEYVGECIPMGGEGDGGESGSQCVINVINQQSCN
ncbi:MAG: HEAT repeat domain-containing protein [Cyanobacteria bacterium P01_C01_bin.121]